MPREMSDRELAAREREGYPFVFVSWVDSCENEDNSDIDVYTLPEPQQIAQVGLLVHDEDGYICVAGAIKPGLETYDYVIAIPRCAINSIRYLVFPEECDASE